MSAVVDTIHTLGIRGVDKKILEVLKITILHNWCRSAGLPFKLLSIPTAIGGFGLLPWTGVVVKPKLPTIQSIAHKAFEKTNANLNWRANRIRKTLTDWHLTVPTSFIEKQANIEFKSTIASDNLPKMRRALHDAWKMEIKRTKFTFSFERNVQKTIPLDITISTPAIAPGTLKQYDLINNSQTSFNSCTWEVSILDQLQPYLKEIGITIKDFINKEPKMVRLKNAMLGARGHITEILNWLGGRIHPVSTYLSSKLTSSFLTNLISLIPKFPHFQPYTLAYISNTIWPMYANSFYLNSMYAVTVYNY